jgi:pimeloyl-ACP methyl ester carboxylesterase
MGGLARQAAHLLDALGHPVADVLGVSFGGAVSQELVLANPHRVRRLVLASTMCGLGGRPGTPAALATLATPLRYYSPAFMRLTADTVYGPASDADPDTRRQQFNARLSRPPSVWGYLSQLIAAAGWTSLPWLHRVRNPTLVLAGDADPIVPASNARILAARIPDSRLMIVPGAGHLLLADHANLCATSIGDFLEGTAQAAHSA